VTVDQIDRTSARFNVAYEVLDLLEIRYYPKGNTGAAVALTPVKPGSSPYRITQTALTEGTTYVVEATATVAGAKLPTVSREFTTLAKASNVTGISSLFVKVDKDEYPASMVSNGWEFTIPDGIPASSVSISLTTEHDKASFTKLSWYSEPLESPSPRTNTITLTSLNSSVSVSPGNKYIFTIEITAEDKSTDTHTLTVLYPER